MSKINRIHNAREIIQTIKTLHINDQFVAVSGILRKFVRLF